MPLILFSKWPEAGKVKTRLAPLLGNAVCTQFADSLIFWSVANARQSKFADAQLAIWPPRFVTQATERYKVFVFSQGGGDLGDKMAKAIVNGINNKRPVVILGCDVPHIDTNILNQAYDLCESGTDVIGPTEDGGFYLICLHRFEPSLFANIAWGGGLVFETVWYNYCAVFGETMTKLPILRDIDTPDDLRQVASYYQPVEDFLQKRNIQLSSNSILTATL